MSLRIFLGILVFIPFSQGQWQTGGGTNGNPGGGGGGQDVLNGQSAPAQRPSLRQQQQQQLQQLPGFPQQLQQTAGFPQQLQQTPGFPQQLQQTPGFTQQLPGLPQNFQTLPQQNNFLGERGQMLLLTNGAASIMIANRDRLPRERIRRVGVPVSLIRAFAIQPEVLLPRSLTANAQPTNQTPTTARGGGNPFQRPFFPPPRGPFPPFGQPGQIPFVPFRGRPPFLPQLGGRPGFPGSFAGQQFQFQQPQFLNGAGGQGGQGQDGLGTQGQFPGNAQQQGNFPPFSQAQQRGNFPFNQGLLAGQGQGQGGSAIDSISPFSFPTGTGTTDGSQLPTNGQGLPQSFNGSPFTEVFQGSTNLDSLGQTQNQGASLPWMQTGNGQSAGLPTNPFGQTPGLQGLGGSNNQLPWQTSQTQPQNSGVSDLLPGFTFPGNSGQSTGQGNTGSSATGVPDFSSLLTSGTGSGTQPFDFSSLFGNNGNTGGTGGPQGTQAQTPPQLPTNLLQGLQALQSAGPAPGTNPLGGNQGGNPLSGLPGAQNNNPFSGAQGTSPFGNLPSLNLGNGANGNNPFAGLPSSGLQSTNPLAGFPNGLPSTGNSGNNPFGGLPLGNLPGGSQQGGLPSSNPFGNLPNGNTSPGNNGNNQFGAFQGLLGRPQGNNPLGLPGGSQLPGMQANNPFNANPFAGLPNLNALGGLQGGNLTGLADPLGAAGLTPFLPPGFPQMGGQFPSNTGATQTGQSGTSTGTGNNQGTPGVFNPPTGMDFLQGLGTDANPFPGPSGTGGSTSGTNPLSGLTGQSSGLSPFSSAGSPSSNPVSGGGMRITTERPPPPPPNPVKSNNAGKKPGRIMAVIDMTNATEENLATMIRVLTNMLDSKQGDTLSVKTDSGDLPSLSNLTV